MSAPPKRIRMKKTGAVYTLIEKDAGRADGWSTPSFDCKGCGKKMKKNNSSGVSQSCQNPKCPKPHDYLAGKQTPRKKTASTHEKCAVGTHWNETHKKCMKLPMAVAKVSAKAGRDSKSSKLSDSNLINMSNAHHKAQRSHEVASSIAKAHGFHELAQYHKTQEDSHKRIVDRLGEQGY